MSMLTREWAVLEGFSNADECCTTTVMRRNGDEVEVAYFAYNGIKVVTLKGVNGVVTTGDESKLLGFIHHTAGDDWELAFTAKTAAGEELIIIDSNDEIVVGDSCVEVTGSYIYEEDEYDELEEEVILQLGLL